MWIFMLFFFQNDYIHFTDVMQACIIYVYVLPFDS